MAEDRGLLRQSQAENYGLRSLFFYRKLQEGRFKDLCREVAALDCTKYDFRDCDSLGITVEAAEFVKERAIPLCHVFCHPQVIAANPRLIAYYRGAAAISQKGVHKLSRVDVRAYELGTNRGPLLQVRALSIARVLNQLISSVATNVIGFDLGALHDQVLMTGGVQADGSWRQEIGNAATSLVKQMIVMDLTEHGRLAQGLSPEKALAETEFSLANGYHLRFGSEPDISIREPDGVTEAAVIEVKGGMDEAGALERYGAAKKSFDDALNRNARVITVYLASCITPTVEQRIRTDRSVREIFNLTRILVDADERERFLVQLHWWMHLSRATK